MTKSKFLALFTAMVLLLSLPAAALAQVPALPHTFVGSVMMGEEMAAEGTMVVAMIDGEKAGNAEVMMDGKYRLQIILESAPADDTVSFMVGEMDAMETGMYMAGDNVMLDLTSDAMMMPDPDKPMVIVGPQGERGLQGEAGEPGADGPAGPAGRAGARGAAGADGADGNDGARGAAGAAGADGNDGNDGARGAAGAAGAAGADGADGAAGGTGPAGATGPAGGGILGIIALIVGIVALVAAGGAFLAGRRS